MDTIVVRASLVEMRISWAECVVDLLDEGYF